MPSHSTQKPRATGGVGEIDEGIFMMEDEEAKIFRRKCHAAAQRIVIGAIAHPFVYSKTLIQLGYEPLPLVSGREWYMFGAQVYYLPHGIKYIRHIHKKHGGLLGCYTGVDAALCSNVFGAMAAIYSSIVRWFINVGV